MKKEKASMKERKKERSKKRYQKILRLVNARNYRFLDIHDRKKRKIFKVGNLNQKSTD